jgi:hypothetical protein
MDFTSKTLHDVERHLRVLTNENNSEQVIREQTRTTGTPYRLHDIFDDLAKGMSLEDYTQKYWACLSAPWLSGEDEKARIQQGYAVYHLYRGQEIAAREFLAALDTKIKTLEEKGLL